MTSISPPGSYPGPWEYHLLWWRFHRPRLGLPHASLWTWRCYLCEYCGEWTAHVIWKHGPHCGTHGRNFGSQVGYAWQVECLRHRISLTSMDVFGIVWALYYSTQIGCTRNHPEACLHALCTCYLLEDFCWEIFAVHWNCFPACACVCAFVCSFHTYGSDSSNTSLTLHVLYFVVFVQCCLASDSKVTPHLDFFKVMVYFPWWITIKIIKSPFGVYTFGFFSIKSMQI